MGFKKIQILAQNPKVYEFQNQKVFSVLPKKHQFVTKTDGNSIFLGHKDHIPDRLHIIVSYIGIYGFYKFSKIRLKTQMG
jgi:hypothetical protein